MKRIIAATTALVVLTGVTYAVVHTKQTQPHTEPVAASPATDGLLAVRDDREREILALRASRSRSAASVTDATLSQQRRTRRALSVVVKHPSTRRAASAPTAGVWYRLVRCEASGHWDYGKPGHYIDRGYNFEGGPNFTHGTWVAYGGRQFAEHAYDATPAQQIIVAERVLRLGWKGEKPQGPGAWPHCSYVAGMR